MNLFRNAGNADELAFAVGALSHYIGEAVGHSQATNVAVPVEFPKLKQRYGNVVNYAQGEEQHVRTEFAFESMRLRTIASRQSTTFATWVSRCRRGNSRSPSIRRTACARTSRRRGILE